MGGPVYRFDNSWHIQWIQAVGTPKKSGTCPYYQFSFNAVIVELLNRGQGGRQMRIFSRYETLSVVAAVTLVLGVFVPDAELKKIIFGIGIFWFIASSLARKFSRQAHAHEDLADAFDDDELIGKMPAALLSYYREKLIGSGYSIYRAGGEEFPILTMESWIPSPAEHPNGIFPTLELPDKKNIPGYHQNVFGLHFPFELNPGKSFRYAFDAASLTNTLLKQGFNSHVKIKPVFTTEKGNRFEGKPFLYPLEC